MLMNCVPQTSELQTPMTYKPVHVSSQNDSFLGATGPIFDTRSGHIKHVMQTTNQLVTDMPNAELISGMHNNNH